MYNIIVLVMHSGTYHQPDLPTRGYYIVTNFSNWVLDTDP